ncbi:accessory factor UbiK family protein [Candidatus Tokpelaia sp.]|uniref:accessory factor UbiK family protein n=1 Tax=Candidatus Tokpelaia sp. TaxID=2233777 RepID=UPI003CC7E55B
MMTNSPNKLLDDFARLMLDTAGAAKGMRGEVETAARAQMEALLNKLHLVRRDEFEIVKEMAVKARAQAQALAARVEKLEEALKKN